MELDLSRDVFGLKVRGLSMNLVYPTGTTVLCVPLAIYGNDIQSGDHVVCHLRHRASHDRVAIREVAISADGHATLRTHTDQIPLEEKITIAWPPSKGGTAITELGAVTIIAVVVASYRAEPAGIRAVEEAQIRWRDLVEHRKDASPEQLLRWIVE